MGNTPPNNRSERRPTPGREPSLPLSQIGRDDALLIPIAPHSSIDEIIRQVQEAGASRVELLVPDGTAALQSIAGNERLRDAARAAGVRVALYTADEQTSRAARIAKLEVVNVGSAVAPPSTGSRPPRAGGQPPAAAGTRRPAASPPPGGVSRPAQEPATGPLPPSDAEFLSQLAAFDQRAEAAQPAPSPPQDEEMPDWLRQSDEGATLYDSSGDLGVPRPAHNDREWQAAFDELAAAAPTTPAERADRRRGGRPGAGREPAARPTFWQALMSLVPRRLPRTTTAEDEGGMRMPRPQRTPEEIAARRRQSRNLALWPALVFVAALVVAIVAVLWSQGLLSGIGARTLVITPPLNNAQAVTFDDLIVPLSEQPVTQTTSIAVQGVLLSEPVEVTLAGQATGRIVAPIGYGRGTVILRNRSSQPITIPAGEVFTGGGQEFVLESDVTIPPRIDTEVGTTFGVAEATLVARTPGAQGNVPPGTINAPPARFSGNVTVSQPNPFSGGSDQEVTVVSPDDVGRLLPRALSELYARGVQAIQRQVEQRPGYQIVQSPDVPPITPTEEQLKQKYSDPTQLAVFPPIGQVTQDGQFTLQLRETFSALAGPVDQPIDAQLRRAAAAQISQRQPELAGAAVEITGWTREGNNLRVSAVATPPQAYLPVPDELVADIEAAIRGRSRAEAQAYLEDLRARNQIGEFQIPPDWETIPQNVRVVVREPEPTQP